MSIEEAEWWLDAQRKEHLRLARKSGGENEDGWLEDDQLDAEDEDAYEDEGDLHGGVPTHLLRVSDFGLPDIEDDADAS